MKLRIENDPNILNLQAFQNLLNTTVDRDGLKNVIIEVYANYSRQVIHYYEKERDGIAPIGNVDNHLYYLLQLIATLDAHSEAPLFEDLTKAANAAKPSASSTSNAA